MLGLWTMVNGVKWKTVEEFESHHHSIIRNVCDVVCPDEIAIIIADMSCDLWSRVRKFARRDFTNLCLDCCYAILKMSGNGASKTTMDAVGLEVLKRPITTWSGRYDNWWEDPRARKAIFEVCEGEEEDIMPLYQDLCR